MSTNLETIEIQGETLDISDGEEVEHIELPILNKPPPKPKVEIRTADHCALMDKIFSYKKTFPKECEHIEVYNLDKANLDVLNNTVELCKRAVADRPNSQMHKMMLKAGLSFGELYVGPKLNMNLRGLTNTAMNDEELMKTLDEIALMQDWSNRHITPEQRFMFGLTVLAMKVNNQNKMLEKSETLAQNPPTQKETEKFDEL